MTGRGCAVLIGAVSLGVSLSMSSAQANCADRGVRATALIIDPPTIDGDLSDWPDLVRHSVGGSAPASFRVAYSPETDRVYLAIEVEDDDLVVGGRWNVTDAADIYTWGGDPTQGCRSNRQSNPIQWAVVPGAGEYNPGCGNPCAYHLSSGPVAAVGKGADAAWRRTGNMIIYEASVPVYDEFRGDPVALKPGGTIGFDLLIVDHDHDHAYKWEAWGNPEGSKFQSPSRVVPLTLSPERATSPLWDALGTVASWAGQFALYCIGLVALVAAGTGLRRTVAGWMGGSRMGTLEQRVTDTQDVMIAMSEKYDRLEERFVELAAQIRQSNESDKPK